VIFHEDQKKESVMIDCLHYLVINYITFNLRSEFNIPLFNGFMSRIIFRVGPGSFISSMSELEGIVMDPLKIPMMNERIGRKTVILLKS
jgi:hypothetical protein